MKEPAVTGSGLEFDGLRPRLAVGLGFTTEDAKDRVGATEETGLAMEAVAAGRFGVGGRVKEGRESGKCRVIWIVGRNISLVAK